MRLGALGRLVQSIRRLFFGLISKNKVIGKPRLMQPLHAVGRGCIRIGDGVAIGYYPSPGYFSSSTYLEARHHGAVISIGDATAFNNGFVAIAEHTAIQIGRRCLIGTNVEIYDSDFHGLAIEDRQKSAPDWARPVVVGDDVFIGSNFKILKGVNVGQGSVIANGAVVLKDVKPHSVVGGNPARYIKSLK